jgi:hypothetical protein
MNVETFAHAGFRIDIWREDDPDFGNPRDDDNLGIMFCEHRDYTLGDMPKPIARHIPELETVAAIIAELERRDYPFSRLERAVRMIIGATTVLPLILLDHSGLYMQTGSFACDSGGWDSGQVGIIFDSPRTRAETGAPLDDIARQLESEVTYYSAYLQGDVYGWSVTRETTCNLGRKHDEVLESCGGYVVAEETDMDDLRSEAIDIADSYAAE